MLCSKSKNFTWYLVATVPLLGLFIHPEKDNFFFKEDSDEIVSQVDETKPIRTGPACVQKIVKSEKNCKTGAPSGNGRSSPTYLVLTLI